MTVLVRIRDDRLAELRALLAEIEVETRHVRQTLENVDDRADPVRKAMDSDAIVPFARARSVHFARFVVLEKGEGREDPAEPRYLLFATDFDGALDGHLTELANVAGEGLDEVFRHCVGYPDGIAHPPRRPSWGYYRTRLSQYGVAAELRNLVGWLWSLGSSLRSRGVAGTFRKPLPSAAANLSDTLPVFLRAHMVEYGAFFVGTRGRTVEQIRADARLVARIRRLVAETEASKLEPMGDLDFREYVRETVSRENVLNWLEGPPPEPRSVRDVFATSRLVVCGFAAVAAPPYLLYRAIGCWFGADAAAASFMLYMVAVLGAAMAWPLTIAALWLSGPWMALLTAKERRDAVIDEFQRRPVSSQHQMAVHGTRASIAQDPMTILSEIRPGPFRMALLRLVLWTVDFRARRLFYKGLLRGVGRIHFARWLVVPGQRRLLFLSNYNDGWEDYLGDFITHAASGITAIWSNVRGFPPTSSLLEGGAASATAFKEDVDRDAIVTDVWFSAYPALAVESINTHTEIRRGLYGSATPDSAREWREALRLQGA